MISGSNFACLCNKISIRESMQLGKYSEAFLAHRNYFNSIKGVSFWDLKNNLRMKKRLQIQTVVLIRYKMVHKKNQEKDSESFSSHLL